MADKVSIINGRIVRFRETGKVGVVNGRIVKNQPSAVGGTTYFQTVACSAGAGIAALIRQTNLNILCSAGAGVAAISRTTTLNIACSATGTPALTTIAIFVQTIAATAVGTAALAKTIIKTIATSATGTPAIVRKTLKIIASSATGTAGLTAVFVGTQTIAVAAGAAVAALATSFIAATIQVRIGGLLIAIGVGVAFFS